MKNDTKTEDTVTISRAKYELPEDEQFCPDCGGGLHIMMQEIREELKLIPAKAVIVRHVLPIYICYLGFREPLFDAYEELLKNLPNRIR